MIRVLFVCHGNICRSPMAEFIFKDMLEKNGLSNIFEVSSSATSTEEIYNGVGNPIYKKARAELLRHNIPVGEKRAKRIKALDYEYYDYLIGMDSMNIKNIERITGHTKGDKIYKLLEFANSDRDCRNPWYTDRFDEAYNDILLGCRGFLEYLKKQNKI